MRDIRQDLQDRLSEVAAQRQRLEELERALIDLLKAEEQRWSHGRERGVLPKKALGKPRRKPPAEQSDKTRFLMETLADRRPWPLDLLVDAAEERGIQFGGKHPRRVLHFVLIGMMQRGIVEKVGDSDWKMVDDRGSNAGLPQETPASLHS